MAKIKIVGNVAVVESTRTLEDIRTLEKYAPKSLYLYETNEDGKKSPVFRVCTAPSGSINSVGACFADESYDERAVACITIPIPAGTEDVKAFIMDTVGQGIVKLNKIEDTFAEALAKVEADKAAVLENIELA